MGRLSSENRPQRGQFLPDLQAHSPALGQEDGEKWTVAVDLQPTIPKSDRLLDNLVDLIVTCLTHPAAANQTFLVSDGEDVSTSELLRRMGQAMGRPARLIPVPVSLLKLAAALVGKPDVAQRLCGSLQVDIEKTRRLLGWTPPISQDEGLRRAARSADERVL